MKRLLTTLFAIGVIALFALPRDADALTVSPPYFDYSLNPGDTMLDVIKLYNETPGTATFYPVVMNFGADDQETGTPQFYSAEEDRMGRGLAKWISVDTTPITIPEGGRANLQFAINVPKENAQPGGHYGAILFATTPPTQDGIGVGVASQLASIILVRVSGDITEVGGIAGFGFSKPSVWFNYLPIDFFLRFENSGNVHLRPTGNLIIKNWYGRKVASIKVNSEFKSVLPMSIRRYEFSWEKAPNRENQSELRKEWQNFAIGKYKALLMINYGSTNQVLVDERTFYVWPWRLMTICFVGLVVLLVAFGQLKKQYDRGVYKRFEKMQKAVAEKKAAEEKKVEEKK